MNKLKKKTVPFTQIPNQLLQDKEITQSAVGLYVFMSSKPDNWNFTIASISRQIHSGQSKIRACLTLLKDKGWIEYIKFKDGTGEYTINFEPSPFVENKHVDKPSVENPHVEFPIMGFSTRISKKDSIVRKIGSKTDCNKPANSKVKKPSLIIAKPAGVSDEVWQAFKEHRKSKKAKITNLVINKIIEQSKLASWTLEDALTETVVRNWVSFKAEWVKSNNFNQQQSKDYKIR